MPAPISFEVITPAGLLFQADVWEVRLPAPEGQIGILPHHIPLITLVVPGEIIIRRHEQDGAEERIVCGGGLVEIDGRRVRVLADEATLTKASHA
jgi:F-type H+-transporting ATPase subunit epsilon